LLPVAIHELRDNAMGQGQNVPNGDQLIDTFNPVSGVYAGITVAVYAPDPSGGRVSDRLGFRPRFTRYLFHADGTIANIGISSGSAISHDWHTGDHRSRATPPIASRACCKFHRMDWPERMYRNDGPGQAPNLRPADVGGRAITIVELMWRSRCLHRR